MVKVSFNYLIVFILLLLGLGGLVSPVQAQLLPIVEFPDLNESPQPSPSPSSAASAQPSPRATPSFSPTPTPTPNPTSAPNTPRPESTPPPAIIADEETPDPTIIPIGGPEVVQTIVIPEVIEQFREQISEPEPQTNENMNSIENQTPGEIISPIIPREVFERIIPSGLYKEDGLDPVDGLAMMLFGVGFIISGIALLRPDAFLPALAEWEGYIQKNFLRRDGQTMFDNTR